MGLRLIENRITLNSVLAPPWSRILVLLLGLLVCFGIGIFLAAEQYIPALGLFTVFSTFSVVFFPYIGLLLFAGLVYIRPQAWIPGLIDKPVVLVLMLVTLGSWLVQVLALRRREFVKAPQNYLMLGLLTIGMISTIRFADLTYMKDSFIELFKIVLLYALLVNLVDTHRKFSILFWLVIALTTYTAVLGILQYYGIDVTGVGIGRAMGRGTVGRIQGVGIFDNPNYLAYCVILMLPAAVCLLFGFRFFVGKLIAFAVSCIMIYCVYLTRSRGGYLCATLTLGFLFFYDKSTKVKLMGAITTIGAAFVLIKLISFMSTVLSYGEDSSAMGRIVSWQEGFDMLLLSPLFGFGYNKWYEYHHRAPHNSFVQIGAELGVIGLFIWIGLLYWNYKYLRAIIQTNSGANLHWSRVYSRSLTGTLFAYVIASCFAGLGYFILLYIFVSLITAAAQVYIPEENLKEISRIRRKDLWTIGLMETFVIIAWRVFSAL